MTEHHSCHKGPVLTLRPPPGVDVHGVVVSLLALFNPAET